MLRLLPGISSLLITTLPVLSPVFFQNLSRVFPVLAVANTGSCVGPQSKIGLPALCCRQLMQVPVLSAAEYKYAPKHVLLFFWVCAPKEDMI